MKKESIQDLFDFLPKSKIKAGDGLESGIYPFYTSSEIQSKYLNDYQNGSGCLVFGTGGKASVHFTKTKFATSTDCISIQPKNPQELFGEYVFQYLKGNIEILETGFKGAGLKHISKKYLSEIKIPLPPLDDQKRIAYLLGKVEGIINRRKQHLQQLDVLLKSVFLEMFGDPMRNEKGWEKKKIDDFADVRIGPFGSLLHSEDYIENGIPLINPCHMVNGEIIPDQTQTITIEKYQELESYQLKFNDIVVARRGEIGRCALVRNNTPLFCGTGGMFIRITTDYYPLLLQYQIYNTSLKEYLLSKAKGVTMKNLNSTTLGNLEVLYPPITLQNQFAAIVQKVESLKARYQYSLSNIENLYGALSQKAFKGELDLGMVALPVEEETDNAEEVPAPSFDEDLSAAVKRAISL